MCPTGPFSATTGTAALHRARPGVRLREIGDRVGITERAGPGRQLGRARLPDRRAAPLGCSAPKRSARTTPLQEYPSSSWPCGQQSRPKKRYHAEARDPARRGNSLLRRTGSTAGPVLLAEDPGSPASSELDRTHPSYPGNRRNAGRRSAPRTALTGRRPTGEPIARSVAGQGRAPRITTSGGREAVLG
jgi:hypothetical protein